MLVVFSWHTHSSAFPQSHPLSSLLPQQRLKQYGNYSTDSMVTKIKAVKSRQTTRISTVSVFCVQSCRQSRRVVFGQY